MDEGQEEQEEEIDDIADEEEEIEGKDLFKTPVLDKVVKDPKRILNTKEKEKRFQHHKQIEKNFNQDQEKKVHPGFVSSYSFGENEFERLKLMLFRLDESAERVMTYRKENLVYFPEFYATLNNFFICIYFIVDSTNRKKIKDGLAYVRSAVIDYTTQKEEMNSEAILILSEIYLLLSNIKNFHGLGFSYEKKKDDSERYYESFFKKKK